LEKEDIADAFIPVLPVGELVPAKVRIVELAGRKVALGLGGSGVFAFEDRCSHAASSFAAGRVIGECLVCPMHGARFDTRTGACVSAPYSPLRSFETRIVNGMIEVALSPRT
jgi:3-phenylpropionate/trans-cinnamate dioxygenase ferredoxin subunit